MHPFFQDYNFYGFVHRGGDEIETENTLEAFKYSSDLGFVYIETDVQATKDGKVVIFQNCEYFLVFIKIPSEYWCFI